MMLYAVTIRLTSAMNKSAIILFFIFVYRAKQYCIVANIDLQNK